MQVALKTARKNETTKTLPPLEPSPRVFVDDEPVPHVNEPSLAFVSAGPALLAVGGIAAKLVDARLRPRGGAPVANQATLRAVNAKIADLARQIDERRAVADDADLQLQELHLRPSERFVWLAPIIGGDADVAAKGAVLRQERNAAARDLKQLRASLAKAHGDRDALLASTLTGVPAFDGVTRKLDDARRLTKKLDDCDDAAFRALVKIAPSLVVGEKTRGGTTAETAGPMNLSQKTFLDYVQLSVHDVRSALERSGAKADVLMPSSDVPHFWNFNVTKLEKHARTGEELQTLRADLASIRAALAPEIARLEQERHALLEEAAAKLA